MVFHKTHVYSLSGQHNYIYRNFNIIPTLAFNYIIDELSNFYNLAAGVKVERTINKIKGSLGIDVNKLIENNDRERQLLFTGEVSSKF